MNEAYVIPTERPRHPRRRKLLAWCVHFYTATGLLAAAGIAVLLVQGTGDAFRWAFVLMFVATIIDATDGTLARRVRVKEVLPSFDGRRLDDLIDFHTYTTLPLLLIWRAGIVEGELAWGLLVPLLASAYGFSQVSAKTDDGFFLGFPSYWNLVAFYLYVLRPPGWLALSLVLLLALLTFVPTRYLYPTQRGALNRFTNIFGALWAGLLCVILARPLPNPVEDATTVTLTVISLTFPIYYLLASWIISVRIWRTRRGRQLVAPTSP
jgi:phosphatidylcholine synthase